MAEESALKLSSIKFSRLADGFRLHVDTVAKDVPMKIWMENQRSKDQWECVVEDIAEHAPRGAKYMLPSSVVVASLMSALRAKSTDGGGRSKERKVEFSLTRLNVDATQVLEAQIRDLLEDVVKLKAANALASAQSSPLAEVRAELRSLTSQEISICSPKCLFYKRGRSCILHSRHL
ncbi:hypothetical protein AeMF1_002272 [Aphanomyces euteiches]|nr:hypothetical protein AeMF1_002272 [Aphanomyces euteiches]KAH9190973.1 hypothetical protein AeNC1_007046 [Aphanomyces euteiches]